MMQLSAAQDAANRVDPDATLIEVGAYTSKYESTLQIGSYTSLQVYFDFVRPSVVVTAPIEVIPSGAGEMLVSLQDNAPASTLEVNSNYGILSPAPTTEHLSEITRAMSTLRISPAQALEATLTVGRRYAEQHTHTVVSISSQRASGLPKSVNVPVAWAVRYISPSGVLSFYVDVQTGIILAQEELNLNE
jgi:hypothetical protein